MVISDWSNSWLSTHYILAKTYTSIAMWPNLQKYVLMHAIYIMHFGHHLANFYSSTDKMDIHTTKDNHCVLTAWVLLIIYLDLLTCLGSLYILNALFEISKMLNKILNCNPLIYTQDR